MTTIQQLRSILGDIEDVALSTDVFLDSFIAVEAAECGDWTAIEAVRFVTETVRKDFLAWQKVGQRLRLLACDDLARRMADLPEGSNR